MSSPEASLRPLRRDRELPLHRKAELLVRELTATPEYSAGGLLPDEITLANRLGISRGTMRAAIARLVAEGRLERRAGVGTRVVQRASESAIGAWRSLSTEMARHGVEVQLFRLRLCELRATPPIATALRVEPGTPLQRLDRVHGWDGVPILRSRSWFHPRVRFERSEGFLRPLYAIVEEVSGLSAERASEAFEAEGAGVALARDLRIPVGSAVLLRRHTVFDSLDRPLEFAEIHYASRRFTLTLDLRRDAP
jgi:GntR family transcriptional regulator